MEMVVGCDADGILTDLSLHNIREGSKIFKREALHPEQYSLEEIFDLTDVPKPILYLKAFRIYVSYCKKEPPREYASETIKALSEKGFSFHSVSARKFATSHNFLGVLARKWFRQWLDQYNIHFTTFQFCSEERSPQDKLLACKKLNVEVMIEDKPEVALYLAENGIRIIMIDAPYNQQTVHENIVHAADWRQVRRFLEEYAETKAASDEVDFVKKDKDGLSNLSLQQKLYYFNAYKRYLKSVDVNVDALVKGDRIFKSIYSVIKLPARLFYKVTVIDKEKIPYQSGFIIASNHNDSTDQYRLGLAIGNRPFVGYAAKEIENTFRGRLFKWTGLGIFIDRSDPEDKAHASEQMAAYVAHDRIALVFPEGTRKNKTPYGQEIFLNQFKLGTVALAQKTGTGILPVSINAFGRNTLIRFGEMIYVDPTDNLECMNRVLESEVAHLGFANIEYYYKKKRMNSELEREIVKYQRYLSEINQ